MEFIVGDYVVINYNFLKDKVVGFIMRIIFLRNEYKEVVGVKLAIIESVDIS